MVPEKSARELLTTGEHERLGVCIRTCVYSASYCLALCSC